jgi:hypothetical protein
MRNRDFASIVSQLAFHKRPLMDVEGALDDRYSRRMADDAELDVEDRDADVEMRVGISLGISSRKASKCGWALRRPAPQLYLRVWTGMNASML